MSEIGFLSSSIQKQSSKVDTNVFTFEAKITKLDKPIGEGCPVYVFEKATGNMVFSTITDLNSFVFVPNLSKALQYFVVANDKTNQFNSVLFDLTWDFSKSSEPNYSLKYYERSVDDSIVDAYLYTEATATQSYDQTLINCISVPNIKEDNNATWFVSNVSSNVDEGYLSYFFRGTTSSYTYINFTPVGRGQAFTFECFFKVDKFFNGTTVTPGYLLYQSYNSKIQGLYIDSSFRLCFKREALNSDVTTKDLVSISPIDTNNYNHIALTYDKFKLRLFINGVLQAESDDTDGLYYAVSTFCLGYNLYGRIASPTLYSSCKYTQTFTPNYTSRSFKPVVYQEPTDAYANNVVLKTFLDVSKKQMKLVDVAGNTPLSDVYSIKDDSYIINYNQYLVTPTSYQKFALNSDFTIELKFRMLSRASTNPLLFGNGSTRTEWTTSNWHVHFDIPGYLNQYAMSIYNVGISTSNIIATYPALYNEPVSIVLQRKGNVWSYYFNGFLDKSITYATTTFDSKTASYFALGCDLNMEVFDCKITKGVARYSANYIDSLNTSSEGLKDSYYRIANYPFKSILYDTRSSLNFINNNIILSKTRSVSNTYSASFGGSSYLSTTSLYWYTPYEDFTIAFKISVSELPATDVIATLVTLYHSTLNNFKVGIKNGKLGFYNGSTWTDSTLTLDTSATFKHIAIQRTGSTLKLLAEGSVVLTTTMPDITGRRNINIGANSVGAETFKGFINNLEIYKAYCKYSDVYNVPVDNDESVEGSVKEPTVVVNSYVTSALNFENNLTDLVGTTTWSKEGSSSVVSTNKIYGDNSFQTVATGDSLYSSSTLLTGSVTPFTIEFYALLKGYDLDSNRNQSHYLFTKNNNASGGDQAFHVSKEGLLMFTYYNGSWINAVGNSTKVNRNEINKYTLTYDGAALRGFVDDTLHFVQGRSVGLNTAVSEPYMFMRHYLPSYSSNSNTTYGLIDNINIFNGIANKVRDVDLNADLLTIDAPFDAEDASSTFKNNGNSNISFTKSGTCNISITQKYNGFSSCYFNNGRLSATLDTPLGLSDFTIEFCTYSSSNPASYPRYFQLGNNGTAGGLWFAGNNTSPGMIVQGHNGSSYFFTLGATSGLSFSSWIKYRLVRQNGIFYLYCNDILVDSNSSVTTYNITATNLYIGQNNSASEAFYGFLDSLKVYQGIAIFPTSPVGKIQLDFDNSVVDKYNNSTWTNSGVTFDNTWGNSVKGYSAKFTANTQYLETSSSTLNYGVTPFLMGFDFKETSKVGSTEIFSNNTASTAAGSLWYFSSSSNGGFDYFSKPMNASPLTSSSYINSYYNSTIYRSSTTLHQKTNDVICGTHNIPSTQTFNFVNGGTFRFGKPTTTFSSTTVGLLGYLDNFKTESNPDSSKFIIDRPAVHFPLEKNYLNIGYTSNLTTTTVGSVVSKTLGGKKYCNFVNGVYFYTNTLNIFNLGLTDFVLRFNLYLENYSSSHMMLMSNGTSYTVNDGFYISVSPTGENNKLVFHYRSGNIDYQFRSTNQVPLGSDVAVVFKRIGNTMYMYMNDVLEQTMDYTNISLNLSNSYFYVGTNPVYPPVTAFNLANLELFVGTNEVPTTYSFNKVLDLDFKPTRKSYLFKDNNNKCIIHPVNITQRDYQDSQYCCTFNGVDQYLQLGKNDLFNFGYDDFVINIKFTYNHANNVSGLTLISSGNTTWSSNSIFLVIGIGSNSNKLCFGTQNTSDVLISNDILNNGYNEVILYRNNGVISMVVNGNIIVDNSSLSSLTYNFNSNNNTIIGKNGWSSGSNEMFNGTIYSIKVLRNTIDTTLL